MTNAQTAKKEKTYRACRPEKNAMVLRSWMSIVAMLFIVSERVGIITESSVPEKVLWNFAATGERAVLRSCLTALSRKVACFHEGGQEETEILGPRNLERTQPFRVRGDHLCIEKRETASFQTFHERTERNGRGV